MARLSGLARSSYTKPAGAKSSGSSRKANALGFTKRQAQKAKSKALAAPALDDVYEYQHQKGRRSRTTVTTRLDREERAEFGIQGDGDEDDDRAALRARLIGENENEELGSDEDEEIDSDAAFEEEDDDRFAGFRFSSDKKLKGSSKKVQRTTTSRSVRFVDVDLNEYEGTDPNLSRAGHEDDDASAGEEDGESEEEDEEMVDLVDILDGRHKPYFAEDSDSEDGEKVDKQRHSTLSAQQSSPSANSSLPNEEVDSELEDEELAEGTREDDSDSDEGEEEEETGVISASEDEGDADAALNGLSSLISGLDSSNKRKSIQRDDDDADLVSTADAQRARKRRIVGERTEAGAESEFAAQAGAGAPKLNLEDLLGPLESQPSSNLISLKKTTKVLASTKSGPLSAPLPTRTQERLDREAAYEQTKEEVDKWSATMKRIKEAEHLSFPLQAETTGRTSNLELNAKFKPTTKLESAVDRLLKTAQMRDEDIQQTEALKMNHLSPEEVTARRAELRKMRELMYRAEVKAKRVAKIKSKTYRRIRKKEKAKLAAKLGEAEESDPEDEDAVLRREVERARERATLRHKNTGKWAKAMQSRGELEEDQRQEIGEMLERGERLRRKIQGRGSEVDESEDEGDMSDADVDTIKANAFDELRQLDKGEDVDAATATSAKSVFQMKFMKDAMARDKVRADRLVDDFVKEMGTSGTNSDDDEHHISETDINPAVQRIGGRVVFQPGAPVSTSENAPLHSRASDTSSITLRSTDVVSPVQERPPPSLRVTPPPVSKIGLSTAAPPANPWLLAHEEAASTKVLRKKNEVVVSKDSATIEKSRHKLRKRVQAREEAKAYARADAEVEIAMNDTLTNNKAAPIPESKAKAKRAPGVNAGDDASDADSEVEAQEEILANKRKGRKVGIQAFQQRELVAAAFAGDNVMKDFEEAKRREMQEDAPQEIDTTLPGWGSWGGAGTRKQAPKPHLIKRVAGVDPKSRADYGKAHVIISEKRDKKAAKYLVKDLPYPYTSKAQFERSIDTPLGAEWNTRIGFQRGTLPKVVKKMGTVISPLEKQT